MSKDFWAGKPEPTTYTTMVTKAYDIKKMDGFLFRLKWKMNRLEEQAEILKNLTTYVSSRDWLKLPSRCPECGDKMEIWFDGTYGCANGHVMAYTGDDGIMWWIAESKVLEKLDSLKADLIEWSRNHDPPEDHTQIDLWCEMNRIIGKYFGVEWMVF